MQTFLPFADYKQCAAVLDRQRLGKQRVECLQIINAIAGKSKGWKNHPATKMWTLYPRELVNYSFYICEEWTKRGYKDTCYNKIFNVMTETELYKMNDKPSWLNKEELYKSHRAALLFKNFEHYKQFGWIEQPELNYYWPV